MSHTCRHHSFIYWNTFVLKKKTLGRVNLEIQYQICHLLELYLFILLTVETLLENMPDLLRYYFVSKYKQN